MSETRDLIVRQVEPYNAGPSLDRLCRSELTPKELFFVRNHGNIPRVDPATYRLTVEGAVPRPLSLSLDDLSRDFPRAHLAATLQCAGNRRQELTAVQPIPGELMWEADAIGNALWTGAPLRAVLAAAGVEAGNGSSQHVAFIGLDETTRQGQTIPFGGSIPLDKAFHAEVLLAYEMNGEPLPPVHGYPVRVLVAGYFGARSVKWLRQVTVQAAPSENYFQAHAYRLFPPQARPETVDWTRGLALGEMPVNAVICDPRGGTRLAAGPITIRGYALTGGDRQVVRVDLSADGGKTWIETELSGGAEPWSWRLWQARVELPAGRHELVVRAVDSAANTQPEDLAHVWNMKGYVNNAWHRVTLDVA